MFEGFCKFLLFGYDFDFIEDSEGDTLFTDLGERVLDAEVSLYHLIAKIGVYASGIAIIVSAILLIINSCSGGTKLADSKTYVIRVLIVSILLFGVTGLVLMVDSIKL